MPSYDRLRLARDAYGAYEAGDRGVIEELLSDDFTYYSPADVGIDRVRYFERCWPNSEMIKAFDLKRVVESGDEVIVTYESTRTDERPFAIPRCSPLQATRSAGWRSTSAGASHEQDRSVERGSGAPDHDVAGRCARTHLDRLG